MAAEAAPERTVWPTEERAEVNSDMVTDFTPLAKTFRMIIRNSVSCVHCGEVVGCTQRSVDAWVEHKCDDSDFAIAGGAEHLDRMGSPTDYQESSAFQTVVALHKVYNPTGQHYFGPNETG